MPHLSIFTVCDRIIIDQAGIATLIGLFGTVTINRPEPVVTIEMPPNAVAPKEWAIFTRWDWDRGDEGKKFFQHLSVMWPGGTVFFEQTMEIVRVPDKRVSQLATPLLGLPIGEPGMISVNIQLKSDGATVFEAKPVLIEVLHIPAPTPPPVN